MGIARVAYQSQRVGLYRLGASTRLRVTTGVHPEACYERSHPGRDWSRRNCERPDRSAREAPRAADNSLAQELGPDGITVNAIAPGIVLGTEFWRSALGSDGPEAESLRSVRARAPVAPGPEASPKAAVVLVVEMMNQARATPNCPTRSAAKQGRCRSADWGAGRTSGT